MLENSTKTFKKGYFKNRNVLKFEQLRAQKARIHIQVLTLAGGSKTEISLKPIGN